jgi:putative endonuclease
MDKPDPRHARGEAGEDIALRFLETRGYCLVARHMRAGRRELDLVVERGRLLVAVEVKWRRSAEAAGAAEAWRPAQRARAAEAVLLRMEAFGDRPWRFDLVTLEERPDGLTLTHRPGAWSPKGSYW